MKKNTKKVRILTNGVLYYTDKNNCHAKLTRGNRKIGRKIYTINLLPGCGLITLKDGTVLSNITGSCCGCGEICENFCYAMRYVKYHHNTCIRPYAENTLLARTNPVGFCSELKEQIEKQGKKCQIVRIHSSGEFVSFEYMRELFRMAAQLPHIIFYGYTKRVEWLKMCDILGYIPDNVHMNISPWNEVIDNPDEFAQFIYDDGSNPEIANLIHCPAVDCNGKSTGITCYDCQRCIRAPKGQKTAVHDH